MTIQAKGAHGFLLWLKNRQPWLYARVKDRLTVPNLKGLGIDINDTQLTAINLDTGLIPQPTVAATSGWSNTIQNVLTTAASAYLTKTQLDAQKKILNMQLDRARQGLPPLDIDPSQYGVPSVKVGLSSDTSKVLLWGGVSFAALLVLLSFTGRRQARG